VAFVLPAFLLMTILSAVYFSFGNLPPVRSLFTGLAAIVVAIILNACVSMSRTAVSDWRGVVLAALAFGTLALRINLVLVLVGAAILALGLFRGQAGATPAPGGQR